ncbi:MAG TPA: pilus assembly protein N-terminal domain-containing protein, partial [Rhodospirillales bacterium]
MTGATNHRLAAVTFMAAAFLWTAAAAQEVPRRQAAPAPSQPATVAKPASPAKMPAADGTTGEAIVLTLNKARVVALSRPVGKIIVGNEAVADVHFDPSQPTKVYILSKAIGTTNVFFLDRRGETIEHLEVRVAFDENGIKDALKRLMPEEYIDVSAFRDSVFLTGKVRSASAAKNAANIARRFVAADANVTNM